MDSSMLEQEINVYSDKYDIKGVIKDYGMVIKLVFSYNGRRIVMGMSRPFPGSSYELLGQQIIDSYVDNLVMITKSSCFTTGMLSHLYQKANDTRWDTAS